MWILNKSVSLIVVLIIAHVIPILSRDISGSFYFYKNYSEPYNGLIFSIISYLLQILFTILALKICIRGNISKAGFNFDNKDLSIRILKKFIVIWSVAVIAFFVIALNLSQGFGSYIKSLCPPDFCYILKDFITGVILAGIGEEPLFRSFVVLTLINYWDDSFKLGKLTVPHVSIISGFIFMTAHIGYNLYPSFTITHLDPLQLLFTFVLGTVWATIFVKTRSLLCPVLAHSGANAIQYATGYITSFIIK